jgi:DNA-binding CsgD family transcriptional regulator
VDRARNTAVAPLGLEVYRPRASLESWTRRCLEAFSGSFGHRSVGAVGRILDLATRRPRGGYMLHACPPHVAQGLLEAERTSANRVDIVQHGRGLRRLCGDGLPDHLREDPYVRELRRRFREARLEDMRHLTATGEGVCVTVGVLLPAGVGVPANVSTWSALGEHFSAGLRLQLRVEALRRELTPCADEAIVSADGEVLHAEGAATDERLHHRLREMSRSGVRSGPEVEEVWRGVLEGRWSVVDRHDHDGRRYLVAVPVADGPRDLRRLTDQELRVAALAVEGHSDKWIAHTLDVARSTVATHLHAAMTKLGVDSRVQLVRAFTARAAGNGGRES